MHGAIHVLDDATIAQIAAGEVIERPVSVVKELVENSLDAGATRVAVELVDGGREAIVVSDDGFGIAASDLSLALARHATSKLRAASDLFSVRSLGFRGEGLASIASAADVAIVSRIASEEVGARIETVAGKVGTPEPAAAPLGTKVEVRRLFYATPARRQFLKSGRAEYSRVSALLTQLSLGRPAVAFSLKHDGREIWNLAPAPDPMDRLEAVFGKAARGALMPIEEDLHARVRVRGFTNKPGADRPNRNGQVFFVNGRLVRSSALGAAWLAGYGSSGMTGRYPFGALMLELPPEDVDVNVHPTKVEVRFADARGVFDALRSAIARTLRPRPSGGLQVAEPVPPISAAQPQPIDDGDGEPVQLLFDGVAPDGRLHIYGQLDRTYILAGGTHEIYVIDQHAAHERIAYEAIMERSSGETARAPLLFPTVVELTPSQAAVLEEYSDDLAAAGIEIEPFGDGAYRVNAVPTGYFEKRFDLAGILDELIADNAQREGVARKNRVIATIACHSVVRAGEPLSLQEQYALFERLKRCKNPQTCAHGRPTMIRMDGAAFEKAFKRT